eukprot:351323-Chlamydomonas_euryale.AAC.10
MALACIPCRCLTGSCQNAAQTTCATGCCPFHVGPPVAKVAWTQPCSNCQDCWERACEEQTILSSALTGAQPTVDRAHDTLFTVNIQPQFICCSRDQGITALPSIAHMCQAALSWCPLYPTRWMSQLRECGLCAQAAAVQCPAGRPAPCQQ